MRCDVCGNKRGSRSIAGISICESCFKKLSALRNGEIDVIRYFSSSEAYENSTSKAKEYFQSIVESKKGEIEDSEKKIQLNKEEQEKFDKFLCTTTDKLDKYTIDQYIDTVSGEAVIGTGFLSEIEAGFSDFLGTTSVRFANKIDEAREVAVNLMKKRCITKGANAAIGVSFSVTSISTNMIMVCVTGTAVKIELLS